MIDLPGIIPFNERNEAMLALIAVKSPNQVKDIQEVGEKIVEILKEQKPEILKKKFKLTDLSKDSSELLEEIAIKRNRLLKGGKPDVVAVSKMLLMDWQKGKIK